MKYYYYYLLVDCALNYYYYYHHHHHHHLLLRGDVISRPPKEKCPNKINKSDSTCTLFGTISKIKAKRTEWAGCIKQSDDKDTSSNFLLLDQYFLLRYCKGVKQIGFLFNEPFYLSKKN